MTYACILMDPPWPETGGGGRGAQHHYDVVQYADIPRVVLSSPEWKPARAFWCGIWTTKSSLPHALALMGACGAEYVTTWTWVKESAQGTIRMGMGQYGRHGVEFILWGRRGMPGKLPTATKVQADFPAPVGEHSEKPAIAYESAAMVFPGPRLEMFARGPREGWDVHGNEARP